MAEVGGMLQRRQTRLHTPQPCRQCRLQLEQGQGIERLGLVWIGQCAERRCGCLQCSGRAAVQRERGPRLPDHGRAGEIGILHQAGQQALGRLGVGTAAAQAQQQLPGPDQLRARVDRGLREGLLQCGGLGVLA